jgi:ATP-dependent RNA helicase DDX54/DBP10
VGSSEISSNQFGSSGRRFKYTKKTEPKAPDRFRDDYHVKQKKALETAKSNKEGGQLRTVDQIRKLRVQKDQRKKKNARHSQRRK